MTDELLHYLLICNVLGGAFAGEEGPVSCHA